MSVWNNPANVAIAKSMWIDGRTALEIAQRIGGITRNSVISKVSRMGLGRRNNPGAEAAASNRRKARRTNKPYKIGTKSSVQIAQERAQAMAHYEAARQRPDIDIPPHERKTLLVRDEHGRLHANDSFTSRHCRYPLPSRSPDLNLQEYCARPVVAGLAYCEHHAIRVSQIPLAQRQALAVSENVGEKNETGGVRVREEA